jgi:hypothetical protein
MLSRSGASLASRTSFEVVETSPAQGNPGQTSSNAPAVSESENALTYRRNWGRWGANDQLGAVNLITAQKRAAAAALVKTGRTVSLGRVFEPDQHFIRVNQRGTGGSVVDYYGFLYHGVTVTHVDALCHVWDRNGMWNGRDPTKESIRTARGLPTSRHSAVD